MSVVVKEYQVLRLRFVLVVPRTALIVQPQTDLGLLSEAVVLTIHVHTTMAASVSEWRAVCGYFAKLDGDEEWIDSSQVSPH